MPNILFLFFIILSSSAAVFLMAALMKSNRTARGADAVALPVHIHATPQST